MGHRIIEERLGRRGEEEQTFDHDFWRARTAEERFAAAFEMVAEAMLFRGEDAGQSRLQRSVQHVQRRAR
jgi:hypothetical protein